jgi:hypothetical protein
MVAAHEWARAAPQGAAIKINQDVVVMPPNPRSALFKRHRPAGPSCRGGASSVLRLAQPQISSLSGWLGRAAELALPTHDMRPSAHTDFVSSIITRLAPSHELSRR